MDLNLLATFVILVGLEIVLGIDNVLLIAIVTDRLPKASRNRARVTGLGLALILRFGLLFGAALLVSLSEPIWMGLSYKSFVLLAGGAFLLFKAVKEIHHTVESRDGSHGGAGRASSFASAIAQIVVLDLVFSIDSVITAVGLTDHLWVIYAAVLVSFGLVLAFSSPIARFVQTHATLKILALAFLVTIGVTLVLEGLGAHVPKGYIYLPMGFALGVELLQMRFEYNRRKRR